MHLYLEELKWVFPPVAVYDKRALSSSSGSPCFLQKPSWDHLRNSEVDCDVCQRVGVSEGQSLAQCWQQWWVLLE